MDIKGAKMKRGANITSKQKQLLLEFLKNRPNLLSGKFSRDFTPRDARVLWEELTELLNNVPAGTQKKWREWRKTWQDFRSRVKSKTQKIIKTPMAISLSTFEEDVLKIINNTPEEEHDDEKTNFEARFVISDVLSLSKEKLIKHSLSNCSENSAEFEDRINLEVEESMEEPQSRDSLFISTSNEASSNAVEPNISFEQLVNPAETAASFNGNIEKKLSLKEQYYHKKLYFMEQKNAYQQEKLRLIKEKKVLQQKQVLALQQVVVEVRSIKDILMQGLL